MMILGGLCIYLSRFIKKIHYENLETKLSLEAKLLADGLLEQMKDPAVRLDHESLTKNWAGILESRVTIMNAKGVVLGDSHTKYEVMDNHFNRPEIQEALLTGEGMIARYSETLGYSMVYASAPIREGEEIYGFVRVAKPTSEVEASVSKLLNSIFWAAMISSVVAVILSSLASKRITIPLQKLTQVARRIADGNSYERYIPHTKDEVERLAYAIDAMARQLHNQIISLKDEQNKLEAILRQLNDGVVITDQEGIVILVNPSAEKFFNIKAEKAIGRTITQVIQHYQLVELWQANKRSGEEQALMMELPQSGIFIQAIVTSLSQHLTGYSLILIQDLTELRRLEMVRRDFVSNISHELRTPLASLKALAETLQSGALEDREAGKIFLNRIDIEVDSLSYTVNELLELARIESGQVPLQMVEAQPCNIFSQAYSRLKEQAERGKIKMEFVCEEDIPTILADPSRLEQVFVNLIHNAIKFTPEGGRIVLEAKQNGNMIHYTVKDNGIGIPSKDLKRIFERFYKSDQSRSSEGTGLGLAIARNIVEGHGGRIWAESVEGKGSEFQLEIPIAEK